MFDQDGTISGDSPESPTKESQSEKPGGSMQSWHAKPSTNYYMGYKCTKRHFQKKLWVLRNVELQLYIRAGCIGFV